MTATGTKPARQLFVPKEVVVGFSAENLKTPFILRCGAVIIDYLLFILFPAVFLLIGRAAGNDGSALLNSEFNNVGWLLAILVGFSNLIVLPAISGRTAGKFAAGLQIVRKDGSPPSVKQLVLRQTLGYLLTLGTGGLGFVLSTLSRKGRALHDLLFGTVVIFAKKETLS